MSKTVKLRDEDYQDQTYTVQNGVKIPLADGSGMATAYFAEGTLSITVNGSYDVRDKAAVNVAVSEGGAGSKMAAIITRSITELTAEDLRDIVSIGDYAFCNCVFLEDVTLPSGLQTIGASAFSGCTGLTSVTIPDSVTSLGVSCFGSCSNLASITLPGQIAAIPNNFCYGAAITAIDFPDTVTSIGEYAFSGCSGLTTMVLPNSVTGIGSSAFSGCSGLTALTLPNQLDSIPSFCFSGCENLGEVELPASVSAIGHAAFSLCLGLTSVTVRNPIPPTVSGDPFILANTDFVIYVPAASVAAYQADSGWSRYASRIQAIPTI